MRKLVTFQRIKEIHPIKDADNIERAVIMGWNLVVKKSDNFKPGDWVVYFEVDSFLPVREEFEWLRKSSFRTMADGTEGFKIRTAQFRGIYSQGLAFSIFDLEKMGLGYFQSVAGDTRWETLFVTNDHKKGWPLLENEDITDLLGVKKWEAPVPPSLQGISRGNIPNFMVTDEVRIEVLQHLLDKYVGKKFYISEKLEGTSFSAFLDLDNELHICSRTNDWLKESENTQWKWAIKNDLENKLRSLPFRACIQGELIGEGIEGNWYKMFGHDIRFFNVIDIDKHEHLGYQAFVDTINRLGFKTVPILDIDFTMIADIPALKKLAINTSAINNKVQREGIVFRPLETIIDGESGVPHNRISFKSINDKYLVSGGN